MTYRRSLGASALLVAVTVTGCAKQQQQKPQDSVEEPQPERISQLAQNGPATQPAPTHTDLDLSPNDTTNVLALKTASYAAELERLLAERAAEAAAARAAEVAGKGAIAAPKSLTTKPAPAKSEVTWVDDPKQLPTPTPGAPAQVPAVAKAPASDEKPTIHQLLDTAPATANRATAIPSDGAQVAVKPTPVIDVKPQPQSAQPKQATPEITTSTSDALARKLSERIQADPLDVGAHLDYQLLKLINDQSVPELNAIAPLPQEDREIVSALLDGLSNFRTGIRTGGNALLAQKVGPIVQMGERVGNQSTLGIPTLALCREVNQYGVYEPFASTRFPFGEKHLMVVYCEVANFASQANANNLWETKLKYEVMVYTDSDKSLQVWQQKPTPVVDHCHSRRRDFFIAKLLELPQDLPIGPYLMKVSIVDETANRIAESTVPLQIVAK